MTTLVRDTLIEASPTRGTVEQLREVMAKNAFACLRGSWRSRKCRALDKIKARFDPANDHAVAGNSPILFATTSRR